MAATICADDYALDVSVSEAILDLFAQGAINATSCLVTSPLWADYGLKLKSQTPSHQANQYGLHINLTQGASLTGMQGAQWFCFKGVLPMIIACYLGCIKMEKQNSYCWWKWPKIPISDR